MKISIEGTPQEIAALALAVQERQMKLRTLEPNLGEVARVLRELQQKSIRDKREGD